MEKTKPHCTLESINDRLFYIWDCHFDHVTKDWVFALTTIIRE